jgi:DNA polymerase sigma
MIFFLEFELKKNKNEPWVSKLSLLNLSSNPNKPTTVKYELICNRNFFDRDIYITISDNKNYGLIYARLVKEYLNYYKALKPLIFIVKEYMHRTNFSHHKGMNSYCLILLITYFLQVIHIL